MEKCMDLKKAYEIVETQEKLLQFDSFTNANAWELGCLMVEEVKKRGVEMAICIRKINGNIVFQYASDGTSILSQKWMQRKFNTVSSMEMSSMRATVDADISGNDLSTHAFSKTDFVLCGGGFPIRIKGSGIVMVITVSNLSHEEDHDFIICCLEKYLGIEAPHLNEEIPLP